MVESGPPSAGGAPPAGAELRIAGIGLSVPPGQSVALLSQPREVSVDVLDAVGGLKPQPSMGDVLVDGVAVNRLRGPAMDRYRASRGLISTRFPLMPSRSVLDNVLAALPSGRANPRARGRALELLQLTGVTDLPGPAQETPAKALTAEQRWRALVARALLPAPRLVLADDPAASGQAPGLEGRAATAIWDLLTDMHTLFGFTLLVAASRTATAIRCQRIVTLSGWAVTDDELTGGDDPWTRGRVDRIG